MDDFSREFCNWDRLREQRNKIKTEIDNNIENLRIKDANIYMEHKSFTEYKTFTEYRNFLEKIRDTINIKYESRYQNEADKIVRLIEIFCYLSDIEYILTQIRLKNIYIKNYE